MTLRQAFQESEACTYMRGYQMSFGYMINIDGCNLAPNSKNNKKSKDKSSKEKEINATSSQSGASVSHNQVGKCSLCDELLYDSYYSSHCDNCGNSMHTVCWDPDAPLQVCKYLSESRVNENLAGLRVYCVYCVNIIDNMRNFESRLQAIEFSITSLQQLRDENKPSYAAVAKRNGNNLQPNSPPANTASSQAPSVQEEVAEAFNKERRKLNVVIFNLAAKSNTQNEDSVEEFFLDLVPGANATPLICN